MALCRYVDWKYGRKVHAHRYVGQHVPLELRNKIFATIGRNYPLQGGFGNTRFIQAALRQIG